MLWDFIEDPVHRTQVKLNSKRGKYILGKYMKLSQRGGHGGICAVNAKSGGCRKSKTADGKCVLSAAGRCVKKSPKTKSSPVVPGPDTGTGVSSIHLADIPALDVVRTIDPAVFTICALYRKLCKTHQSTPSTLVRELKKQFTNGLLDKITFNGSKFGDVGKYKAIFEAKLGKKWASQILNLKNTFNGPDFYRLGVPGRQGTVFKMTIDGYDLAVKVTRPGAAAAPFLRQARFQQLAATHNITCPVQAVYCGGKKDYSFMVMDAFKYRLIDLYKKDLGNPRRGVIMSEKHQRQLFQLYYILDTEVGVLHNDYNCLNVMIDQSDNVRLIDFDRSSLMRSIKKGARMLPGEYNFFPNTLALWLLNCFTTPTYNLRAPEIHKIINERFPYRHCTPSEALNTSAWNKLLPR